MKKTIVSLAVLLATTFSFSAFAQAPAAENACPAAKTECCKAKANNPFEGITLTADQQAKLDALQSQRAQAKKDAKQAKEAQKQAKKDAKNASRKDYLNSVKAILTPEQYVTFLENSFVNQAPKLNRDGKQGMKRGDKAQFKGDVKKGRPDMEKRAPKGEKRGEKKSDKK